MDPSVRLRAPAIGDLGWIVHRQALLYAEEYGWNAEFEGLVAGIVSQFIRDFDPARERGWVADRQGGVLGSIFLVRQDDTVAKLRMLYVDRDARGLGIGRALVDECVHAARAFGYQRVTLWTHSVLTAAIALYQRAGFRLTHEAPHHNFGKDLVEQTWDLIL